MQKRQHVNPIEVQNPQRTMSRNTAAYHSQFLENRQSTQRKDEESINKKNDVQNEDLQAVRGENLQLLSSWQHAINVQVKTPLTPQQRDPTLEALEDDALASYTGAQGEPQTPVAM